MTKMAMKCQDDSKAYVKKMIYDEEFGLGKD